MRIALAHDSFTQMGGAERVIEALHEMFPDAPVFTLVLDPKFKDKYAGWDIKTSPLQTIYLALGKLQYFLPLIPWAVDQLDLAGYDVVVSSSSSFIKNIRLAKNCIHINYCHTPTRFLWSEPDYVKQEVSLIIRPIIRWLLARMKKWDYLGAQRVSHFIANSQEVQKRIQTYYHRTSTVIHPCVDTEFWKPAYSVIPEALSASERLSGIQSLPGSGSRLSTFAEASADRSAALGRDDILHKKDYFLLAGRLQPHKKNQLIVEIFNQLGLPLHVAGTGREAKYLRSIAKSNISFLGRISDEQLRDEYSGALGFIYPQTEDFGLMPLEAAACGTATIAYAQGGALETIVPGVTGELFETYDKEKIKEMILNWKPEKYQKSSLIYQAQNFAKEKFKENIRNFIQTHENRN